MVLVRERAENCLNRQSGAKTDHTHTNDFNIPNMKRRRIKRGRMFKRIHSVIATGNRTKTIKRLNASKLKTSTKPCLSSKVLFDNSAKLQLDEINKWTTGRSTQSISYIPVYAWATGSCCRGKLVVHYLFNCDLYMCVHVHWVRMFLFCYFVFTMRHCSPHIELCVMCGFENSIIGDYQTF